ncbi:MAG: site-specific DNA-methyltransferase [Bacteroidales bacterium]|jgi:DNA modification methylase
MNKLYFGDNLEILKSLYKEHPQGFIDLIYIDPPFNSKRNYNVLFEHVELTDTKAQKEAFADTWSNVSYIDTLNEILELNKNIYDFLKTLDKISNSKASVSYLTTMTIRLIYMHKLLKDSGSFYLHCDPTMSHYLKIMCDFIFGEKNFRNVINWKRHTPRGAKVTSNQFPRVVDDILFYSKTINNIYHQEFRMFTNEFITKRYKKDENGRLWRDDNLGTYSEESIANFEKEGKIYVTKNGKKRLKRYLDEEKGVAIDTMWIDIPSINSQADELLGYPTQKPETLLERIIKASSNEGDVVADFFCGCGTTITVAERLKRQWLGVDISHLAVKLMANRLINAFGKDVKTTFEIFGFPKDIDSAKELAENTSGGRLKFEEWIVEVMLHGILNENKNQMGYDGYFTFDVQGEKQIGMIEVKSGGATSTQLNHFIKTVESKNGSIGVFVCFEKQITKNMRIIAKDEGFYNEAVFGHHYPKIQIISVESLVNGDTINIPVSTKTTFKVAPKEISVSKQHKLDI